jgi:hypothetical protein
MLPGLTSCQLLSAEPISIWHPALHTVPISQHTRLVAVGDQTAAASCHEVKQHVVHSSVADKLQEILHLAIKDGASAVKRKYCIPMALDLATPFKELSTADQMEVISRVQPVATELAHLLNLLNPNRKITAACPTKKVSSKANGSCAAEQAVLSTSCAEEMALAGWCWCSGGNCLMQCSICA